MSSPVPDRDPLVHGMGTTLVPASWPALTAAECGRVLLHYADLGSADCAGLPRIEWLSPRPLSAAAIVAAGGRRAFLKRHLSSVRSVSELAEEHDFLDHLRPLIPVPRVWRARDGRSALSADGSTYEVHEVAEGHDTYRDALSWTPLRSPGHASAAGRMLGRLHGAAARYVAPARATRHLVARFEVIADADPMRRLTELVADHPLLREALAQRNWHAEIGEHLLPWHRRLAPYLPDLAPLWTHNDWHGSNLLWRGLDHGAEVAAVIDFGLANRTTAIFDLATALERNTIEWLSLRPDGTGSPAVHLDQVAGLISGYLIESGLSEAERRALPLLLPLVHIEFALSELEYFAGIVHSAEDAELAYHSFLLGHCRWFSSSPGRHYLQQLEGILHR